MENNANAGSESKPSSLNDLANGIGSLPQATTVEANPVQAPAVESPQVPQEGVKQDASKPAEQGYDNDWWKKDARFGKMWKSEQDIIKSYFEADKVLETKYKPAYKQYEGLRKKLEAEGLSDEKIDDYIKEYKSLRDPNNPRNQRADYFSEWIDNPLHRDKVVKFFQDMETAEMERKYPNMTAEARQKMIELENRVNEFEKVTKEQQQSKMVAEYKNSIDANLKDISKYAESKGFEFTDNIKDEFLDYCAKEGIEPNRMIGEFIRKYNEGIDKAYENRLKAKMLEEQQKNNKNNISFAKPKIAEQNQKKGFVEKLSEAMTGNKT